MVLEPSFRGKLFFLLLFLLVFLAGFLFGFHGFNEREDCFIGAGCFNLLSLTDAIEKVTQELSILKKAVGQPGFSHAKGSNPPNLLEPLMLSGTRNTKELDNFIWGIEQCFHITLIPMDEQVQICPTYFVGDAKLWWQMQASPALFKSRLSLMTWDDLRVELQNQFLPGNSSYAVMDMLFRPPHRQDIQVREVVRSPYARD